MATTFLILSAFFLSCTKEEASVPVPGTDPAIAYTMPEESAPHEGTWLQWPHEYQYGKAFRNRLDATWVAMTQALVPHEKVHLIAYDETEQERITALLQAADVPMANVDFILSPTDDVWVRDNGPIYVKDQSGRLLIEDWGFNAWGGKAAYNNCNQIPSKIAVDRGTAKVDLNDIMVNEGGSIEMDGNGVLMACKSSVLNDNRNPGKTQDQVESVFRKYLGADKFIWLEGKAGLDITDMHIDGFARFAGSSTLVTMSEEDLDYWQVPGNDVRTLYAATNKNGQAYKLIKIPLTQHEVITTYGKHVGKASYINYYIANNVVLVPNYNDPNDALANSMIQALYPGRKVIGIDCRNLFDNGGMIHCVTQQQPR